MFPFHIPDKQYVVSLDKLDLSFLNRYVQGHTDTKRLLWSKPLMDGESVYCEVQIHLDEGQDENTYLEPSESYVCHICNIDVPHQYFKQHVNSSLHATYKKLSEKVLENVSKLININIDYIIDNSEKCDQFYCETCSKIVLMEHKQKHNRSKYHLQCIDNHKLAANFVEIYIDKKKSQNENESINNNKNEYGKIGNNHEYNSESDTDWSFNSDSDGEIEQLFHINNVITYKTIETPNVSDIENIECDNKLSRPSDTNKELTHFQEYLKEIIAKYKYYSKFDLPIIEDNSIVIITPNGYKEKITIDAFHSYKKINSFIFCQLCKERVGQETSHHSSTKRHVKNIMEPVNNSFARVMIGSKAWSHCLLCNDIVASGSDHVNSYHKKPIENKSKCNEAPVPSTSNTMMPKMTFCDVCNVYTDAYDFSTHLSDNSHINKLKVVKKKPNPGVVGGNTASAHNVVSNEKANSVTSKIALNNDMVIPISKKSSDNNIVNSVKSTLKQTNTTESNKLIEVENKITTGYNIPSTSKAKPDATTKKKITTTKKLIEYNKQMAEFNENSVECLVCDLKVPISDKNIIEHVEGFRHKKAVEVLLREHNIQQRSYNLYECKYCNSSFDDFVDHIHENLIHNFAKALYSYFKE